jgi:hypothetical protein
VTIKAKEALFIIRNVSVRYIEVEKIRDENLHAFEFVNA